MQVLETVFSWPFMFDDDDGSDEVFNAVVDEHKIGVETKAECTGKTWSMIITTMMMMMMMMMA